MAEKKQRLSWLTKEAVEHLTRLHASIDMMIEEVASDNTHSYQRQVEYLNMLLAVEPQVESLRKKIASMNRATRKVMARQKKETDHDVLRAATARGA